MKTKGSAKQEWENIYDSSFFHHKNKYPSTEIVSFVMGNFSRIERGRRSKIKILDLGCGWGNNLRFLKEEGFAYYGIDFSQTAIEHCKKIFKNVVCGDISNLPYESNFFDCVFDRMAIQHNPKENMQKFFNEVFRALKPNGLFFSILTSKANYNLITSYLSKKEIKKLAAKFSDVKIDYCKLSLDNKLSLIYYLTAKK
ncbi:class I SAM-dependent methyltransferase [Candidatus Parcubacteria bacterium]|nr:class I SAM-dependent methyltransferase [Candidatus Parcubacteria bacterium]